MDRRAQCMAGVDLPVDAGLNTLPEMPKGAPDAIHLPRFWIKFLSAETNSLPTADFVTNA